VSLSALNEGGGALSGIIAVIIDITEQKRVERELRRARDLAERASRAKSEFLSSISHELRTPLHAILGSAELLGASARLSLGQRERVEDISRAGEYLLEVVDNVLDLVLIESGSMTVAEEPINVEALLEGCASGLAGLAAHYGVAIQIECDEGCLLVRADRRRVEQVVKNLLSNAIKFNEVGGRVVVRARRDRSCWVRVEVEDTGIGIAASRLRDLFTAFNRLGREGGTIAGSGIGLVLAKRLIELMGGTISVSSEFGVGSTFTVRLPQVTPLALPEQLMIHALSRGGPDGAGVPFTLLYVDDFAVNVQMMEGLLAGLPSARLLAASTFDEAMALAANERPDAVFLDPCALGGRAATLVSHLRAAKRRGHMPIYSLCGRGSGGGCMNSCGPVSGELHKPLDVSEFHRLLGELVRRKSGS
jgi:nitrogen-specific signal transduction histidine kinase